MARSVTFNGITMYKPGGITKIDASELNRAGLSSNGVIGLLGESDGGIEPGTLVAIDDPALGSSAFRSGPLADAINLAFDPSDDERVPAGAFRCYCVRVNKTGASRASVTLYQKVAEYTTAAGSTQTNIVFAASTFTADEHNGSVARLGTYTAGEWSGIEDADITDTTTTDLVLASPGFAVAPASGVTVHILAEMCTIYSTEYSTAANGVQLEYEPGASSGQAWTTSFEGSSQISDDIGGKSFLDIEYVGNNQAVVEASGVCTAGAASTFDDSGAAWTPSAFVDYYAFVDDAGALATDNIRKISANTATQVTVTNGWTGTPDTSTNYEIRRGVIDSGAVVDGSSSTVTLPADMDFALNELAGLVMVIKNASGVVQEMRTITSNTAGVSSVVTVDYAFTTAPQGTGSTPVGTDTYEIRYTTAATVSITGASGVATALSSSVAVDGGSAAADLAITFSANQTITELVNEINGNSSYTAYVPNGINGDTSLAKYLDFDQGSTAVGIRNSRDAVSTPPNSTYNIPVPWENHFRQDLNEFVNSITNTSELVTIERSTSAATGAGRGRPEFTGGSAGNAGDVFKYLTGGTRGTSTNSDWQDAFDLLLQVRCNHVVPLISEDLVNQGYTSSATFASVAAQLASHVSLAAGIEKSERGGYIGMKGTRTELINQANAFNAADVQLTGQRLTRLNALDTLAELDEWSSAVCAAGMRSGVAEVGDPLTWKYFRTTELNQDSSWEPLDKTDANLLIKNGVFFAETIRGKGTRWVRDLTTWVKDDNLAYSAGSTRDAVRFVAYGLRTWLEDKFTGVKARPATATAVKEQTAAYLELARGDNIIVDSEDDEGNFVYAFHNIRVGISGNIATIRVQIFPAVGIDFQLTTIHLQLPQASA